jgi:hypothetical protein
MYTLLTMGAGTLVGIATRCDLDFAESNPWCGKTIRSAEPIHTESGFHSSASNGRWDSSWT